MQLIRSLKHRNFQLYFTGQLLSLVGVWMQGTAVSWLVWRLTHSTKWLGAIGFATQIPILVLGLFAGVAADRLRRHTLVIGVQLFAMLQAAILAFLTITGVIDPWLIFTLSLFMGSIFAFDYPSRQSFLIDMVGRGDITNAVALNSAIVHGSRIMGPVLAGFIIAEFGEGTCFAINAASFLFVLASLVLMNRAKFFKQVVPASDTLKGSIKEALAYSLKDGRIRRPLILMAVFSFFGMSYVILLPHIISTYFGGGASELGLAMGAAGLGALIGAIYLATRKGPAGLYGVVKMFLAAAGVALLSLSLATSMVSALPSFVLIGLGGFLVVAGTNTILQIIPPEAMHGRVMSIFTVTFFGFAPIGSLISGQMASFIGTKSTLAICGAMCIIAAVFGQLTDKNN